jgi:hypothetical protein
MKAFLICLFLWALGIRGFTQAPVPAFGDVTDDEKKLKECPFDKEAEAVTLFDKADVTHNDDRNLIISRRIRIKVLKEKGIHFGDIEISYYSANDFEDITDLKAAVYNFDEKGYMQEKDVEPKGFFRKKLDQYWSVVTFAIPEVKVGSIFEYSYTSTKKNYWALREWTFQTELPTMLSSFNLTVLPSLEFAYQVYKRPELPITIKPDKDQGRILFEMSNIAGLRDEPYSDSRKDYIQRVEFQVSGYQGMFGDKMKYATTWDELTRELMSESEFGSAMNKNLPDADLMNKVKLEMNPYDKMKTIYDFVQYGFSYDGNKTSWALKGVKEAWEKKKGSSGDINLILINLLKDAGLEVYPMMVSERGHGKVNASYPFEGQFNNVMAYVIIGNNKYILDAAGPYTPPNLVPLSVINTTAYIVNRKKGGLISLKEDEKIAKNQVFVVSTLQDDGMVKGEATIYSYDYARLRRKWDYSSDKEKFKESYLTRGITEMKIDSFSVKNLTNDSLPMEQKIEFELPVTSSGGYKLVRLNMFSGFEKNPFLSDIRFTNVDYGCMQNNILTQHIQVPEDLVPDGLPKNIRLIMPDTSIAISRIIEFKNNALDAQYKIQVNKSIFTADEYPALKEFFKKMSEILDENVVLRKKTNP